MNPLPLTLKHLFSSKLRVKVLSHFFFHPGESFHVRGLAADLGESAGSVARELAHLQEAGILVSRAVGRFSSHDDRRGQVIHLHRNDTSPLGRGCRA